MTIKCFTIATHNDGYLDILKQSCIRNNINLIILGWNEKYNSHSFKTKKTIEFLKKQKKNQIVLFIDGFDSIILDSPSIIENNFKKLNLPHLFSKDLEIYGIKKIMQDKFTYYNFTNNILFNSLFINMRKCNHEVINTGMFIGYSENLLKIFIKSLKYRNFLNKRSNQRVFQDMCNDNNRIYIDTNNIIFRNVSKNDKIEFLKNKVYINGKASNILSFPNLGNMDSVIKYLKYDISNTKKRSKLYVKFKNRLSLNSRLLILLIILICYIICKNYF